MILSRDTPGCARLMLESVSIMKRLVSPLFSTGTVDVPVVVLTVTEKLSTGFSRAEVAELLSILPPPQ
jgi:hypothetical protein